MTKHIGIRSTRIAVVALLIIGACDNGDVSTTAARSVSSSTRSLRLHSRFAPIQTAFNHALKRVTRAGQDLLARGESVDESPFGWRDLRGGMSFAKLDRVTKPAARWKCLPLFMSAVGLERDIALQSEDYGAGHLTVTVDTVGRRVVNMAYSVSWTPNDRTREDEFERELTALALEWDKVPGVIRHPATPHPGPYFATWESPDSLWRAKIFYYQGAHDAGRPSGFEIEETRWSQRMEARITDAMKGQLRNPAFDYYRKPNTSCEALLKSS